MKAPDTDHFIQTGIKIARNVSQAEQLANTALSILNSSPKFLRTLPDLTGQKGYMWRLTYSISSSLAVVLKSLRQGMKKQPAPSSGNGYSVLLVSHYLSPDQLEKSEDFYLGTLEKCLDAAGISNCKVMVNHAKSSNHDHFGNDGRTYLLAPLLSPFVELSNLSRLIKASLKLPLIDDDPNAKRFSRLARIAGFDHRAMANLRIHDQIRQAVISLRPDAIIFTHEGHGWERMIAMTAHQQAWPIKVIGYHHTVLFPGPRAINFNIGQGADPDHLFFAGDITAEIFAKESEYHKSKIGVLGSNKVLREVEHGGKNIKKRLCLIVPEGEMGEVRLMVQAGIHAARALPDIRFVLRLHPVIQRDLVQSYINGESPPDNFSVSSQSLDEDVASSGWVIYRASSVVLNGMMAGATPIYLNIDQSQHNNDPIPAGCDFRKTADTFDAITEIINNDLRLSVSEKEATEAQAKKFAQSYFVALQPEKLISLLKQQD